MAHVERLDRRRAFPATRETLGPHRIQRKEPMENVMRSSTFSNLQQLGMTGSSCPVTNMRAPNVARGFGEFSISYNRHTSDYGCETTAIVLRGRVFFVLNGNHAEQLCFAATSDGIQGCVDYFVENIAQANPRSEHRMATGLGSDPFSLMATALDVIGQCNINRVAKAAD